MDLHKLSIEREPELVATTQSIRPPRRRWLTRIVLPLAIVLATAALILFSARDVLRPALLVQAARAVAIADNDTSTSRPSDPAHTTTAVVAQAPGWIEPDPYPIFVSGLANGVVETLYVLEGQSVHAGQPLIQLVDKDARLSLDLARADLAKNQAAMQAAKTELSEPIALIRAESSSRAQVDAKQAALIRLDAEIARDQARLDELQAAYERLAKLSKQSVSELMVEESKYRVESQAAVLEATRQRRPELEAELENARAHHDAAIRDLELKTSLKRIYEEAIAMRDAAQTRVAQAELRLERMTIKSPADGVVMDRLVGPGSKIMLDMDSPHSAHAVHLYDPDRLQVRVDVPLADAGKVGLNQRAEIVVDVLPGVVFDGRVTRLVHQADIAKNSVQFKVSIEDPSALLKPDMLARVKFYALAGETFKPDDGQAAKVSAPVALPRSAIVTELDTHYVWWISPIDQRIQRKEITLKQMKSDGITAIAVGLNPGDIVVDRPSTELYEHQRVRISESHLD